METAGVGECPALRDVLPDKASLALATPLRKPLATLSSSIYPILFDLYRGFDVFARRPLPRCLDGERGDAESSPFPCP